MKRPRIIDSAETLEGTLKDFQRRTVEHAYRELFRPGGSGRFLVADEVGLGKTIVARGLIAKMLDLQGDSINRIDVIYVCSNAAIARQNLDKLIPKLDNPEIPVGLPEQATRLTLLPKVIRDLAGKRVNFVSFTPGTTFDHRKSRQGRADERAIIYTILLPLFEGNERRFLKAMCGWSGEQSFRREVDAVGELDAELSRRFLREVRTSPVRQRLRKLVDEYDGRSKERFRTEQNELFAELREMLARVCLDALEPDLVILDEFQRFKDLLAQDEELDSLPSRLFRYSDEKTQAETKVLLLSATPYKMLTIDSDADEDEDHYTDYLDTLRFLFRSNEKYMREVESLTRTFRACLVRDDDSWVEAKRALEDMLLRVMCRTERVALTRRHDAMLVERPEQMCLNPDDIREARKLDDLANYLEADAVLPYWSSVPYALNFLKNYDLGVKLEQALSVPGRKSSDLSLRISRIRQFTPAIYNSLVVGPKMRNHRMRLLAQHALGGDGGPEIWKMLWMPPTLPYTVPQGCFAGGERVTKTLVFSSWNAVPDSIAALLSAEAERRMFAGSATSRVRAKTSFKSRLLFRSSGESTGATTLTTMLPFPFLVDGFDPLASALDNGGAPVTLARMRQIFSSRIEKLLADLPVKGGDIGPADTDWYWAAPLMLEKEGSEFLEWLGEDREDGFDDETEGLSRCFAHVRKIMSDYSVLGRRPADLAQVMAEMAIASPAVCAARSLKRVLGIENGERLFLCAWTIAEGFRSLFNKPPSVALLERIVPDERPGHWRRVLHYCGWGNIQSLLDEQSHMLLGFEDGDAEDLAWDVACDLESALSLQASPISVQNYPSDKKAGEPFKVACRFAMRFGGPRNLVERDPEVARAEDVRLAFDSPFRPFVLASTSIGQEGLDFHQWCHAIMHWNLPSNPVDLEQREGRVHRFKGHAVRKNIAAKYGLSAIRRHAELTDPWAALFKCAEEDRAAGVCELVPNWVFEDGPARIERIVPVVPLSRAEQRLADLKRGLGRYRLAFGQPRQEELVSLFSDANVEEVERRTLSLLPRLSDI